MTPQDLALIIVATDTPDYLSPATATVVQHKLGAVVPARSTSMRPAPAS